MLKHSVILTLKKELNQDRLRQFFAAASALEKIPGVKNFEILKQVSPKNNFEYGIAMEFDGQTEYDLYSAHPQHAAFIQDEWLPCVSDFLEIDYLPISE